MYLSTISEWLLWIASIHTTEIDLGLERVRDVADRLQVLSPSCNVIIVGGTNGKGSVVAGLEALYHAGGLHTGAFTSPFFFKHNEQVRINGHMATDAELCGAFAKVEAARGNISLTSFEFCTLAAFVVFQQNVLDVWILEVGLGGRLDAVNILDADVAVITSIGIDHVAWLGSTREQIASEKAGIFRKEKPVVCGDVDPPSTLITAARSKSAPFFYQGHDFDFEETQLNWSWSDQSIRYDDLPYNQLATQNMSTVLKVVTLLQHRLPITRKTIEKGLRAVDLPGRIQIMHGLITEIYDVSHNPAAIAFLKKKLNEIPCIGKTYAVFSMLADKDIFGSLEAIRDIIDRWYVAPLPVTRAATKDRLMESFQHAEMTNVTFFASMQKAYAVAKGVAKVNDRIVVFGSFHTVAEVWGDGRELKHPTL